MLSKKNTDGKNDYDGGISGSKFYIITTVVYIISITIAVVVGEIGPIFDIVGSIDATSISYLLPCAFYIGLKRKNKKSNKHVIFSYILFISTGSLAITSLIFGFLKKN